jgi:outer membrane immunogenic protein
MKNFLRGTIALVALGVGAPAIAADMGVRTYAAAPAAFSWTGCHLGGLAGYESGRNSGYRTVPGSTGVGTSAGTFVSVPLVPGIPLSNSFDMKGFTGGGYAGCDYQFGTWVVGVEGDWSAMNKAGQSFPPSPVPLTAAGVTPAFTLNSTAVFQTTENWLATARGRLGYAIDSWLLFVTGGAAWAKIESNEWNILTTPAVNGTLQSDTRTGWVIGVGTEYAPPTLKGHWIIRSEYLYVSIPSYTTFTPGSIAGVTTFCCTATNVSNGRLTNIIARVGLAYKFGDYYAPAVTK